MLAPEASVQEVEVDGEVKADEERETSSEYDGERWTYVFFESSR